MSTSSSPFGFSSDPYPVPVRYARDVVARAVSFALLLFVALVAAGGCSAVPVLHFSDDAGADGGPCTPTGAEICDDGIDNDCNGTVDCADPACQPHYACVDVVPDDWHYLGFADGARPACPPGFGDVKDVSAVDGATGPPTCGCACGGVGACSPAGLVASFDNDAACKSASQTFGSKSGCQRPAGTSLPIPTNTWAKVSAGSVGACSATAPGTLPPVQGGRECLVPRVGGGCGASQVCVPRAEAPFASCVAKAGDATCPSAYPTVLHAGSSANDSRACGSCSCTASPCTGTLDLYDNKDCTGGASLQVKAPDACARGKNTSFVAHGYTITLAGGCVMGAAGAGTGTLSFADEATVCCQ